MGKPLNDMLTSLAADEPVEPRGWFRWLHNHYLGRYGMRHLNLVYGDLYNDEWGQLSDKPTPLYERVNDPELMTAFLNRHAWAAGMFSLVQSVGEYWEQLDRTARGAFFAGVTELDGSEFTFNAVMRNLSVLDFTPESLCQLACNAIRYKRIDLLENLLSTHAEQLIAEIRRFDAMGHPYFGEPDILTQVSRRVIDMVLEAALIRNNPEAVKLLLEHGADPDLQVWQLERSYNEKHSGLSYAISADHRVLAELLLEHGASPTGTSFAGRNLELFQAINRGWDDLAERLISKGALLSPPSSSGNNISVPRFFGLFNDNLEWAHTVIGSLIPLTPIAEKQAFYWGNGQGGQDVTILNKVICSLERLKRYEALGLDTRLTAEEFCMAVGWNASEGLGYLLSKYGDDARERVFAAIRERKPEFGADTKADRGSP